LVNPLPIGKVIKLVFAKQARALINAKTFQQSLIFAEQIVGNPYANGRACFQKCERFLEYQHLLLF